MRTSRLDHQLYDLLGQSSPWADRRHLQTLIWMVIGVICSECINLTKWRVYVRTRAVFAQSHYSSLQSVVTQSSHQCATAIHSPLIAAALVDWGVSGITLIEDTSMLWDKYCLIRLSIQYRGRAVPLVWRVIRHGSSSVRCFVYQAMLKRASRLIPEGVSVCFLADRGFADTQLMRYLRSGVALAFSDSRQKQCLDSSTPSRLETTEPISLGGRRKCVAPRSDVNQDQSAECPQSGTWT